LTGNYRNLLFGSHTYACPPLTGPSTTRQEGDLNRLRLELHGRSDGWSWEGVYDLNLDRQMAGPTAAVTTPATWLDLDDLLKKTSRDLWRHNLYRLNLSYETEDWRITAGRQRIGWGSALFWHPTDRFNPVPPEALEPDDKTGVDALYAEWRFTGFATLQMVAAPANAARSTGRKWALRLRDTLGETDAALMAGQFGPEGVIGIDAVSNVGDAAARIEATAVWPDRVALNTPTLTTRNADPYQQIALGIDNTFVSESMPQGLYTAIEYFYNGAATLSVGVPVLPLNLLAGRLDSPLRHQIALSLGYDLHPLLRLEGVGIEGWDHTGGQLLKSHLLMPRLVWSARANLEVVAGGIRYRLVHPAIPSPGGYDLLYSRLEFFF